MTDGRVERESAGHAFFRGLADGAIREPLRAINQLFESTKKINSATESTALPGMTIDESSTSHRIGEIVGSFVPFTVIGLATRGAGNCLLGQTLAPSLCRIMGEQATTGFVMGAFFTPSQLKPGESILSARLNQGGCSALTFAAMSGTSGLLENFIPKTSANLLPSTGRRISIAALSGAAGGTVDVEYKKGFKASAHELIVSSLGYAAFGTVMEAGGTLVRFIGPKVESSTSSAESMSIAVKKQSVVAPVENYVPLREAPAAANHGGTLTIEPPTADKMPNEVFGINETEDRVEPLIRRRDAAWEAHLNALSAVELHKAREAVLTDFKNLHIAYPDAKLSLYSEFMDAPLSDAQRLRMLNVFFQVRNYYADWIQRGEEFSKPAQKVWIKHLAAIAETLQGRNCGSAMENHMLANFFSQLRNYSEQQLKKQNIESQILQHQSAARSILQRADYSIAHAEQILERMTRMSLADRPLNMIQYREEYFARFKTTQVADKTPKRRVSVKSADLAYERDRLLDNVGRLFVADKLRMNRILWLTCEFEERCDLTNARPELFYRQLNRLLSENSDAVLSGRERADLAEQVLHHAARPTTIDQGPNGTCTLATSENRIYSRTPAEMARLVADVANSGRYMTASGIIIDLNKSITGLKPDAEARLCLGSQQDGACKVKFDGARDWASQLCQTVMAKIRHTAGERFVLSNGEVLDPELFVYDELGNCRGFTDRKAIDTIVDARGVPLKQRLQGEKVYRQDGNYIQELNEADLVFNNRGTIIGCLVDKSRISALFDAFGRPVNRIGVISNYFDEQGNFILHHTIPGEVTYDKVASARPGRAFLPDEPGELERLHFLHMGKRIYLKEVVDGKLKPIQSPDVYLSMIRRICNEITGSETGSFCICKGPKAGRYYAQIEVASEQDFHDALIKLQNEGDLPGILLVETKGPQVTNPFCPSSSETGGMHVVNVQGYDPTTRRIKISNQWGSRYDYEDNGLLLEEVFEHLR